MQREKLKQLRLGTEAGVLLGGHRRSAETSCPAVIKSAQLSGPWASGRALASAVGVFVVLFCFLFQSTRTLEFICHCFWEKAIHLFQKASFSRSSLLRVRKMDGNIHSALYKILSVGQSHETDKVRRPNDPSAVQPKLDQSRQRYRPQDSATMVGARVPTWGSKAGGNQSETASNCLCRRLGWSETEAWERDRGSAVLKAGHGLGCLCTVSPKPLRS